jgi:hypothetical protein
MHSDSPLDTIESYEKKQLKQISSDVLIVSEEDDEEDILEQQEQQNDMFVNFAQEELLRVDKAFSTGALNAFDKSKDHQILSLVERISKMQFDAFLSSMENELQYPNVYDADLTSNKSDQQQRKWEDFEDKDHFAKLSKTFQEKEKGISNLVKKLDSIQVGIDSINALVNSSNNSNNQSTSPTN